jgi:hypothetical protein
MASFNRVHGDARPVVNLDSKQGFKGDTADNEFADATGIAINPAGPKLDFFSIVLDQNTSPVDQMGTGGAVEAVLNCVGQLATVHMYQVDDVTGLGDAQLSLAIYPTGAWERSVLADAIEGLGTVNGYDLSDARVEVQSGFRITFENYC